MPAGGRADDRAMIPGGYTIRRILAGILALPLTGYALLALISLLTRGFDPLSAMFFLCPGTFATLLWWYALRGHLEESRARMRTTVIGGFILGGIAFAAGFFGPIVFAPDANQGPLLGIFFTGPLGFVLGCAGGLLYAHIRGRTPSDQSRSEGRGSRAA